MRLYLISILIIFGSFTLSAQCNEYQSELQNAESYINTAIRNLKKAEKAESAVIAQQFIDKAVSQAEFTAATANLAKELATACDCEEGINSATTIYYAAFDCYAQAKNAANCGEFVKLKTLLKKVILVATSVKDEITEGTSSCLKIPEIEKVEIESTGDNKSE